LGRPQGALLAAVGGQSRNLFRRPAVARHRGCDIMPDRLHAGATATSRAEIAPMTTYDWTGDGEVQLFKMKNDGRDNVAVKFLLPAQLLLASALFAFAPTLAVAQNPAGGPPVSFAGKTVTIINDTAPGSSSDIFARMYAKHLADHLPGKPNVIVESKPGGGETIAPNYVYASKPDGQTLLILVGGIGMNQLLGVKAAKFDILKMPAIIAVGGGAIYFAKAGLADKPEDLLKAKGLKFGQSPASSSFIFVAAKELLKIPTDKVVLAYQGGGEARRAFLAGEINVTADSALVYSEAIAPLVKAKEASMLFQSGVVDDKGELVKDPVLPSEIPTISEVYQKLYNKAPSGIAWDAIKGMVAATRTYDKALLLPPGTPANIVKAYWDAGQAMLNDPAFRADADKLAGPTARWVVGEAVDKAIKLNFSIRPEVRDWLKATLPKYGVAID
jgi:tripartite-type tricarboxylate transporter receptor subunit TctC